MQFWALIVDSFRESRDRKIFWVMLAISLIVAAAMACFGFAPGKVTVLFGMWEFKTDHFTIMGRLRADLIATIMVDVVLDLVFGWLGVVLAIIATAGFFPAFMERGTVDVILSKPMSRWAIFLGKYLGSMVFILLHAGVFVLLTFLVVGVRWGIWLPGYLLAIPLMVALFSYLYCVSVLVAVYFRSTVASVIITLGAWFAFAGVQGVGDAFQQFPAWQENRIAYSAVKTARWITPKTADITYLAKTWAGATVGTELFGEPEDEQGQEMMRTAGAIEAERMQMSPVATVGSSLLFEAVVVLLGMWKFSRRDY